MTLPNFLIVGAMKAGTTTLKEYLREHEDIFMAPREIHFFNKTSNYLRGITWYESFFEGVSREKAIGEKTPNYCHVSHVPERIYEHLPHAKLIWILRDPVARAYSHYWHFARHGKERLSFESAIKEELEHTRKKKNRGGTYLESGAYAELIRRFLKFFPKERMLFLLFEDFIAEPESNLRPVYRFLEVNPEVKIRKPIRHNVGHSPRSIYLNWTVRRVFGESLYTSLNDQIIKRGLMKLGYPSIKEETKGVLKQYYKDLNSELAELIGLDVSVWD